MTLALLLGLIGLVLSGVFSGSETGFYRVTRVRLALDAMSGDYVARGLSWLTNHPQLFVATTLIGNNLANYLTSLAAVILTERLLGGVTHLNELVAPLVLAPILFVYGELLPKYLFHEAPNRLLRRVGPFFLIFALLALPLSALLWAVGRLIEWLLGESPQRVQLTLVREYLERVFEEGHEAGILRTAQRQLAQGLLAVAGNSVLSFVTPTYRLPAARLDMSKSDCIRLARRQRADALPVEDATPHRRLVGYVRIADLLLSTDEGIRPLRPLIDVPASDTHIAALMRMHNAGESIARVVDTQGKTVGLLTAATLRAPLFSGGR